MKSSDNSASHAVAIVENYIFDSNLTHAIYLNRENLNWCCSDSNCEETFVGVHLAYIFEKLKLKPEYVLRTHEKRMFGINSLIRAFAHLPDMFQDNKAVRS